MLPFGSPMQIGTDGLNVDRVFATTLTLGSQGEVAPLNFAPELVWQKSRSNNEDHYLFDSLRGKNKPLFSNLTSQQGSTSSSTLFGPDGVSKSTGPLLVSSPRVSWSFRRSRRFFDIVTYTGNGASGRQILHNLKTVPGLVIVKRLDTTGSWIVRHNSFLENEVLSLESTASKGTNGSLSINTANSQNITLNTGVNTSGGQYIAYIFAHDPSPTGIIQCGVYSGGGGSSSGVVTNLGWEPQWLLVKNSKSSDNFARWQIADNKRIPVRNALFPNSSGAEEVVPGLQFTPTGFITSENNDWNRSIGGSNNYIYMAIRKGKL